MIMTTTTLTLKIRPPMINNQLAESEVVEDAGGAGVKLPVLVDGGAAVASGGKVAVASGG